MITDRQKSSIFGTGPYLEKEDERGNVCVCMCVSVYGEGGGVHTTHYTLHTPHTTHTTLHTHTLTDDKQIECLDRLAGKHADTDALINTGPLTCEITCPCTFT